RRLRQESVRPSRDRFSAGATVYGSSDLRPAHARDCLERPPIARSGRGEARKTRGLGADVPSVAREDHRSAAVPFNTEKFSGSGMTKIDVPRLANTRILVAGDVMLDRYWIGDVNRISPEAPVPVVRVGHHEE